MELPQEIEVWYVIPALRRKLTLVFKKRGLKQKDIARLLGITEPAVSQYLKNKRAMSVKFNEDIEGQIEKAAARIIDSKSTNSYELQNLLSEIKKEKLLCDIHKRICKLPHDCEICTKPGV